MMIPQRWMLNTKLRITLLSPPSGHPLPPAAITTTSPPPTPRTTDTKGSPKTFDAGIALYVGMALTSAAGVAFVGKKRED